MKLFSWFEDKHFDHIYLLILYVHATACIWRSEDNLRSSVLILHNMGSRNRNLIAMLGKKCLKSQNHPPVLDLRFYFRPKILLYLRFKALCCIIIMLFLLCVHSCAWIHVVYLCVCRRTWPCVNTPRSEVGAWYCPLFLFTLLFGEQAFQWTWNSASWPERLASELSGSTCLCLPRPILLMHVMREDDAQLSYRCWDGNWSAPACSASGFPLCRLRTPLAVIKYTPIPT